MLSSAVIDRRVDTGGESEHDRPHKHHMTCVTHMLMVCDELIQQRQERVLIDLVQCVDGETGSHTTTTITTTDEFTDVIGLCESGTSSLGMQHIHVMNAQDTTFVGSSTCHARHLSHTTATCDANAHAHALVHAHVHAHASATCLPNQHTPHSNR